MYFDSRTFVKTNDYLKSSFSPSRGVRGNQSLIANFVYFNIRGPMILTAMTNDTKQSIEVVEWLDDFGRKYNDMKVNFDKIILIDPVTFQLNNACSSKSQFFFENFFISENLLEMKSGSKSLKTVFSRKTTPSPQQTMVDLVGRRNTTYIKHGSYVFDCYYEEHDKSSFCWIYEILESAAHTCPHASFIDNRNSELERYMFMRYMFMTAPSAHKVEGLRNQTAYVDIYKPYLISVFQFQKTDNHLQQVLTRKNSNFLTPRRVIELKRKLRAANFILKP
eukprot:Awhi_evm1s572